MASFQALLPDILERLQGCLTSKTFLVPTCILCVCKAAQRLNSHFSHRSLNNFEDDPSWDWKQEIVLITGGSSGIGVEIVRRLSARNIRVVIWDLVAPPADLLEVKYVTYYTVDVTSDTAVASSAARLRNDVGAPTVLINNAGIAIAETIIDEDPTHRRAQFDVNVFAQMRLVQEFLPHMAERNHGHIVTMASASSFISTTQLVTYCATKAAVMAFHEGVGQELRMRYAARKVRTSIVFPHFVRTPMVERLASFEGFPELLLEPGYVADAVVEQVVSGQAGRLVLPPENVWLARLRAWPPWYMYYIHSLDPDVYRKRA